MESTDLPPKKKRILSLSLPENATLRMSYKIMPSIK